MDEQLIKLISEYQTAMARMSAEISTVIAKLANDNKELRSKLEKATKE